MYLLENFQNINEISFKNKSYLLYAILFIFILNPQVVRSEGHENKDQTVMSVLKRNAEAFENRDVDGLINNMAEDIIAYRMADEGPMAVINGKNNAREMLSKTFSQSSSYVESELPETIVVGPLGIQIEEDTFRTKDGLKTATTVAIYHIKDDKIWRVYNFRIAE